MWGSWFAVTVSGFAAVLLLIVAAATAWTPLFAIGIAAIVMAGFAIYFAIRGGRAEADAGSSEVDEQPASREPEHRPRETQGSEVAGGIWGEKREA